MLNRHTLLVTIEGFVPGGRAERFTTIVQVSAEERGAGMHFKVAMFRAEVRGLSAPFRVIAPSGSEATV